MKRIIIIIGVTVLLVGACTATLLSNKKKIDEKSRLDAHIRNIPVFVTELRKQNIAGDFSSNGSFFAIHELTLMSETQGRVVALHFNTGDFVKEGQLLVKLDDELMRSRLSLAEANYEKA